MATNKRKDAAALFELIDRSTLKVPKNAGALKIPSWWSSKTNPAPSNSPAASLPRPSVAPGQPPRARPQPVEALENAHATVHEKEDSHKVQPRLFEPPPADVRPGTSPSFRPPTASIPAPISAPLKVPPAGPAKSDEPADFKTTEPIAESDLPADVPEVVAANGMAPRPARVFAPQTHAQDRKAWSPPKPGSFARLPAWVMVSGIAGIVIVICLIVGIAKLRNSTASPTNTVTTGRGVAPLPATRGGGLLPAPMNNNAQTQVARVEQPPQNPAPTPGQKGTVYSAATYPYVSTQYYVIVCSTPSKTIADRNAGWIADAGYDAAVERIKSPSGGLMFAVVALRGYPTALDAEPFKNTIIDIANAHIKETKLKDAWKTAYATNGLSAPARAPATGRG